MNTTTVLIGIGIICFMFLWNRFSFKRTVNKVDMGSILLKENLDKIYRMVWMVKAAGKHRKELGSVLGVSKRHINHIISYMQKHSDVKIKKMKEGDVTDMLRNLGFYYEMDAEGRRVAKIKSDLSDEDVFFHKAVSLVRRPSRIRGGAYKDDLYDRMRYEENHDRQVAMLKGQNMGGYRMGDGRRGMDERR